MNLSAITVSFPLDEETYEEVQTLCKIAAESDGLLYTNVMNLPVAKSYETLEKNNGFVLLRANEKIDHVIGELYGVDERIKQSYYKLKCNKIFDKITGLILGSFTHMDTEEENAENYNHAYDPKTYEVIHQLTAQYQIPIAYQFPAGHTGYNLSLKMGSKVQLKVDTNSVNLYSK